MLIFKRAMPSTVKDEKHKLVLIQHDQFMLEMHRIWKRSTQPYSHTMMSVNIYYYARITDILAIKYLSKTSYSCQDMLIRALALLREELKLFSRRTEMIEA